MIPTRTYEKPIDMIVSVPIPVNGAVIIVSDMFESYPVCYNSSISKIPIKPRNGYSTNMFNLGINETSVIVKDLTKRLKFLYIMEFGGSESMCEEVTA